MASIGTMEQLEVAHIEIREILETIRTKIENVSIVDNFSYDDKRERGLIEQTISDLTKVSATQLAGLKTRRNALLPINRLPVEILTNIILFANTCIGESSHPYIKYTWVCHRWRSALIQHSAFWTVVKHRRCLLPESMKPIHEEILRRSRSAKLELQLSTDSVPFIPTFRKLFVEENDRICKLKLHDNEHLLQLVLSGKKFPSLQTFALHDYAFGQDMGGPFIRLAPALVASDSLETLHCSLGNDVPFEQLSPIFRRLRNLSLYATSLPVVSLVLGMLCDSPRLRTLVLKNDYLGDRFQAGTLPRVVLPELQFLSAADSSTLKLFRAPKLISLSAPWSSVPIAIAFEAFDFPSIRHLYIRGHQNHRESCNHENLCVLGAKERIHCKSVFLNKTRTFFYEHSAIHEYSRDCFHLGGYRFDKVLETMSAILPRLTHLVELYLLIPHSHNDFQALIFHLPSVERVVVQRGNKLLDVIRFLNKTPFPCPRLRYLSYKTYLIPKNVAKYANDVGRALTRYAQSGRKESAAPLERIILGNCPPLPDTWLEKLRHMGIEVVTEKDAENIRVMGNGRKPDPWGSGGARDFSDVEI